MSTDATQTETKPEVKLEDAKPEKPKRRRSTHRLGAQVYIDEYPVPDTKLVAVPEDWSLSAHKDLRVDDFQDPLHYFQWVQSMAQQLIEAANERVRELEAYGSSEARQEVSEILGGSKGLADQIAATMQKEGLTADQKELLAAQIAEVLGQALPS